MGIKKKIKKIKYLILNYNKRKNLKNKDFTIISDNCWGGFIYQYLGLPFNTPFIGLFIFAPDYIKLLNNLKYYLDLNLEFIKESKFKETLIKYGTEGTYPIGILGDVEIHFLHYKTEEEARSKWNTRRTRINWDNLFIKFSDANLCTRDHIEAFDKLPYKNKIMFTNKNYNLDSNIFLKEYENKNNVKEEWKSKFDYVSWLNKGK